MLLGSDMVESMPSSGLSLILHSQLNYKVEVYELCDNISCVPSPGIWSEPLLHDNLAHLQVAQYTNRVYGKLRLCRTT